MIGFGTQIGVSGNSGAPTVVSSPEKGWRVSNPSGGASVIGMVGTPAQTSATALTNIGANAATGEPCMIQAHTAAIGATSDFGFWDQDISGGAAGNGTPLKQIKACVYRARIDSVAGNGRTWIGACSANVGSSAIAYSNNLLAVSFVGFRFSVGTDLTIKAYCGNTTTQQVVDTGVTPDAALSHQFSWTFDGASKIAFFIDGVQVAVITNAGVFPNELLGNAMIIDNQGINAATHVSAVYAYMYMY